MMITSRSDPNARLAVAAMITLAAIMPVTVLVAPLLVGQLIAQFGFTASQAGYLLSIELAAMCAATAIGLVFRKRAPWSRVVTCSLAVAIAGNLLSALATDFTGLAIFRALVGLGSGTIMSFCLAAIGRTSAQDRNFGLWLVAQLLSGVVGLLILPLIFAKVGIAGFFVSVAAFQAAITPLALSFYDGGDRNQGGEGVSHGGVAPDAIAALASILLIYISISGVWAYVERIGKLAGLSTQFIGGVLAIGTGIGIGGAAAAAFAGGRVRWSRSLAAGFAILMASMLLMSMARTEWIYALAAGMFKFAWTFIIPVMLAVVSARDPSGRLIMVSNFVLAGGIALGPAVGALLLAQGVSYAGLVLTMSVIALVSAALIIPSEMRRKGAQPGSDAAADLALEVRRAA